MAPVHNVVPAHHYNLLGKVVKATALANPVGPRETPPATSPHGATVENGRYIVESVALCWSCHTARNQMTGELTEDDLRAIYRYLKSLPPVKRDVGPPVVEKKKA